MKVYHRELWGPINVFKSESNAYRRLKEKGLCERGIVPDFYGMIEDIDPALWQPHLNMFRKDEARPSALFIEYIPDLRKIDLDNYTTERILKLGTILREIHKAGVLHDDPYPRNMMVQESSDRVCWIDFDRADTFDFPLNERQQHWVAEELEMMDYFVKGLEEDYKEGKISRTWEYYYTYY
ncbi:hypothetical protein L228DRAFT_270662 [Xylona heveae TC161]|uniref:Protein kinase domain-containing protein n=1 Tax=Xylona heveae (strain CBS 132557 / TC161) TaxID=1328760 RepID=A0A165A356_XYLHT|nr:hypothetical protein L228DRAFT_270662 [Xylona heveae TC161]KZF19890.1 hypothetical protein L228DRAFT_270662 [Xylona heveae TC161]